MAITQNNFTGNGSTVLFSFTFPYLDESHIKVSLNGSDTILYTLANATTIQMNTAPANGVAIRVYRETELVDLNSTFFAGSAIRSQDLNDNFLQSLYLTQETRDITVEASDGNIPDGSIGSSKLADGAITTPKILDAAVTASKMAVNSVATASIQDSAVTTAKIAALAVATASLADDAVTNAKIADTAVNTAQLASSAVTTDKVADSAVTQAKIGTNVLTPRVSEINGGALAGMRNRIINGEMTVAQRGTSFPALTNPGITYTLDRWTWGQSGAMVCTATQSSDVPNDTFQTSLKVDVTTADTSLTANEYTVITQRIEGVNVRDLIGTTFTLSFWVKSPKTGIHCVAFRNAGPAVPDRSYIKEYTIATANTWEYKTITVTGGLITAGTWDWTNGPGLDVGFTFACGSTFQTTADAWQTGNFIATANQVNVMDNTANDFFITGVQLEPGSVATPFERRPGSTEFALCQRYFQKAFAAHTATTTDMVYLKEVMRSGPTIVITQIGGATVSVGGGSYTGQDAFRVGSASAGDYTFTASAEL